MKVFTEDAVNTLAFSLGFDLILCGAGLYAIEERGTRGNRWPEKGSESLDVVGKVLRRIQLDQDGFFG